MPVVRSTARAKPARLVASRARLPRRRPRMTGPAPGAELLRGTRIRIGPDGVLSGVSDMAGRSWRWPLIYKHLAGTARMVRRPSPGSSCPFEDFANSPLRRHRRHHRARARHLSHRRPQRRFDRPRHAAGGLGPHPRQPLSLGAAGPQRLFLARSLPARPQPGAGAHDPAALDPGIDQRPAARGRGGRRFRRRAALISFRCAGRAGGGGNGRRPDPGRHHPARLRHAGPRTAGHALERPDGAGDRLVGAGGARAS